MRIASRGSPLALWQANHVASLLQAAEPGLTVEIVRITTSGDQNQVDPLQSFGGVGVFTREVQRAVLDQRADLAVHSLKDLPTVTAEGLCLATIPERAEVHDVLVLPQSSQSDQATPPGAVPLAGLDAIPHAARVGTGSLRRRAQLLSLRPDLQLEEIRGNVETRLRKLDAGEYAALVLAAAGLNRLGLGDRISLPLQPPVMYHAVGQGALGIECRADDGRTQEILLRLRHAESWSRCLAERALLAELRAGCHAPVGVETRIEGAELLLTAVVYRPDGQEKRLVSDRAPIEQATNLGQRVARQLIADGAQPLMDAGQQKTQSQHAHLPPPSA